MLLPEIGIYLPKLERSITRGVDNTSLLNSEIILLYFALCIFYVLLAIIIHGSVLRAIVVFLYLIIILF